jgi:hypothetical protein
MEENIANADELTSGELMMSAEPRKNASAGVQEMKAFRDFLARIEALRIERRAPF